MAPGKGNAQDKSPGALRALPHLLKGGNIGGGQPPHTHCPRYYMFVLCKDLNGHHPNTTLYAKYTERKFRCLAMEEAWEVIETAFWTYGRTLTNMESLNYLGHLLTAIDKNLLTVVSNLRED